MITGEINHIFVCHKTEYLEGEISEYVVDWSDDAVLRGTPEQPLSVYATIVVTH